MGQSVLGHLEGHDDWVRSVSFSPDGQRILSGSDDQSIRVWDAQTGEMLAMPLVGHGFIVAVSFSPDGKRIVSGSSDGTVRIWDAEATHFVVRCSTTRAAGTVTYHIYVGECLFNLSKQSTNKRRLDVRPEFRAIILGSTGSSP
jgi:WD40 repeat protein